MSVSADIKKTILDSQYKNACCRRAFLQGVLASKGSLEQDDKIYITLDKDEQVEFIDSLIKEIYAKSINPAPSKTGGRGKKFYFESKSAKKYLISINEDNLAYSPKCQSCIPSFLKGVFFACGRFSDPEKQFCLEFSFGNRVSIFLRTFEELGIELKSIVRKNEKILYSKNSTVIEDFFLAAELNDTAYQIMNIKIRNEFMNDANRLRNFDTVNISKSVAAAAPLLNVLEKLKKNDLLSKLPDDLAETAKLRLTYPDLSLSQLARTSVPPLSKSGITHRMAKLLKLGNELIAKYKL